MIGPLASALLILPASGALVLREMSPAARAATSIRVGAILASSTVHTIVKEMQQELVHGLSHGYSRPTTSHFQQAVGWTDIPATPGSADVPFADAKFVAPHLRAACALRDTPLSPATTPARADLRGAVAWVAGFRRHLQPALALKQERDRKLARFSAWRRRLAGVDAQLNDLRCPQAAACQGSEVSMALTACMVRAAGLPDVHFVDNQVHGFPSVGDYPDSGCFRECYRPKLRTFGELDHAAHIAKVRAKLLAAGADPNKDRQFLLAEVTRQTDDEVTRGLAQGPLLIEDVDATLGRGKWRPLLGFGVVQGVRADGTIKVRRCDDAAASDTNVCVTTYETIACEDASFPATVISLLSEEIGPNGQMPACHHATDDVDAAYRRAMCANPSSTVVAIYHTGLKDVRYYLMPGHNFGLVSAVLTWNRFSFQAAALARRFFGVPCAPFFDDYDTCEPCYAGRTGKVVLHTIHRWLGIPLALGDKDVPFRHANPFLGVISDLRGVTQDFMDMRAKATRIANIVVTIERFLSSGIAPYGQLESLCGKLEYTLTSSCHMRFGRAAMSALREFLKESKRHHAHDPYESDHLTGAAALALHFFLQLLPRLPPRRFLFRQRRRKPVLVYTDASFTRWHGGLGMIGIVIIDLDDPSVIRVAGRVVPGHILARFRPRKTYIGQLEALAAVMAYTSLPEIFTGREVVHFIDNTGALYGLHHGYSGDLDTSGIVHNYYALSLAKGFRTWWAYVPSAANIADYPSRLKWQETIDALRAEYPDSEISYFSDELVWPDLAWSTPVSTFHNHTPNLTPSARKALGEVEAAIVAARAVDASISVRNSKRSAREQ